MPRPRRSCTPPSASSTRRPSIPASWTPTGCATRSSTWPGACAQRVSAGLNVNCRYHSAVPELLSSDEDRLVAERIKELLDTHDPARTEPKTFWAAQYDLGLAWVQFSEGLGGLGVRPGLQE